MKPQCETAAECLKELARVMEQFGIDNVVAAIRSQYVRHNSKPNNWPIPYVPAFDIPENWQFAIAKVEGKPVFLGDEMYHCDYGKTLITKGNEYIWDLYSWNPPRPKTVMVEMTVKDAEYWDKVDVVNERLLRTQQACKLALEKLNETNTRRD